MPKQDAVKIIHMSYLAQVEVAKELPNLSEQEKLTKAFALGAAFTAGFFCDVLKDDANPDPMLGLTIVIGSALIKAHCAKIYLDPEVYMNLVEKRLAEYAEKSKASASSIIVPPDLGSQPRINLN